MNKKKLTSIILTGVLALGCANFNAPVASAKIYTTVNKPLFAYTSYNKTAKIDVTGDGKNDIFSFKPVGSEDGDGQYTDIEVTFKASDTGKTATQTLADKNPMYFYFDDEESVTADKAEYDAASTKAKKNFVRDTNSLRLIRLENGSVFLFFNLLDDSDMTDPRFYQYKPATGKFALVKSAWLRELFTMTDEDDIDYCTAYSTKAPEVSGNHLSMDVFFGTGTGLGQWRCTIDFGCIDTANKNGKLQMVTVNKKKGTLKAKTNGTYDISASIHVQYLEDGTPYYNMEDWSHTLKHPMYVYTTPDLKTIKKNAKKKKIKLKAGTQLDVTKYYCKDGKTSLFIETESGVKGWVKDAAYQTADGIEPYFTESVFI